MSGHPRNPGYQSGNHWVECERCGLEYRADEIKEEWTGLIVCEDCWEPRHPQDFVRSKEEDIAAADPLNPATDPTYTDVTFADTPTVPDGNFDTNNSTD